MLLTSDQEWHLHQGDCIKHMPEMPADSMDMSVFSPPFPALYAYTSEAEDIGNSEDLRHEAKLHLSFFYAQLKRVLKPGRVAIVHVMQIPRLKRSGETGTFDFRGLNIKLAERSGLVYDYDWIVQKNPQNEAIRTFSHGLQFASLERDRTKMHGQFPDYLLKFRAPGENQIPINTPDEVSRQEWIHWAESSWPWKGDNAIRQSHTLNTAEAKAEDDTKHICPLQLDIIDRCIRLFSNPDEIVFSPFAGIGSEGYVALKRDRKFYGCEIKDEYVESCRRNMNRAIEARQNEQGDLFVGVA